MILVKRSKRKAGRTSAHMRKVPGKGMVRVKASRRSVTIIPVHKVNKPGHGVQRRNGAGHLVYKSHKPNI